MPRFSSSRMDESISRNSSHEMHTCRPPPTSVTKRRARGSFSFQVKKRTLTVSRDRTRTFFFSISRPYQSYLFRSLPSNQRRKRKQTLCWHCLYLLKNIFLSLVFFLPSQLERKDGIPSPGFFPSLAHSPPRRKKTEGIDFCFQMARRKKQNNQSYTSYSQLVSNIAAVKHLRCLDASVSIRHSTQEKEKEIPSTTRRSDSHAIRYSSLL